ncbi:MAG: hypothetical protein V1859_01450 [archaeon]
MPIIESAIRYFYDVCDQRNIDEFQDFITKKKIHHAVTIAGFAHKLSERQSNAVEHFLIEFLDSLKLFDSPLGIICGTMYGIPNIGIKIFFERGYPTLAVMPQKGVHIKAKYPEHTIIVPPLCGITDFGAESLYFIQMPSKFNIKNSLLIFGGGEYTDVEARIAIAYNISLDYENAKKGYSPIPIIPVSRIGNTILGGVADKLHTEFVYNNVPWIKLGVTSGKAAGEYLSRYFNS